MYKSENSSCPNIISRSEWGAREPKKINYLIIPVLNVIIHHTVTEQCNTIADCSSIARSIQSSQMDNLGWDDIGISFLIGSDGNVYEGSGWYQEGAHTYGYNKKSIGVFLVGSFQDQEPSQQMIDTAHKLIRCGKSLGFLRRSVRVIAARQVSSTLSPGQKVFNKIRNWPEWVSNP
ncbi:peptidoglycan recognition protein isoform X2 [Cephus cinctus]|uniref:Peptidoglycan recognition protein isoform X2 n=1 Tax=Cephus cinctus TaxID=211228 RepID=A0AAJ7W7J5_CEPCN|nr:peptidoglycan recognition protein isoform X2 [Cephus cinctus]